MPTLKISSFLLALFCIQISLPAQDKLNIKVVVEKAVRLVQLHAHMKQVIIQTEIEETLTANADKDMVEFIIRNLLSNAIKFSQRNSSVDVKADVIDGFIRIEIIDTGVGLSEMRVKKLLEKNTTLSKRGTEKEKGTGLGLLISKEFIEKNGGKLHIKSDSGKGSNFSFELPLYESKFI